MRIVMLASTYPRFHGDGAGRFVQSLAEAVAGLGHEVHVLTPYHPNQRVMGGIVQRHSFRYVWPDSAAIMGYGGAMHSDRQLRLAAYVLIGPYLVFGSLALQRLARQHQFDVLHAHWVLPSGLMALPLASIKHLPLVISLHGSDGFIAQRNWLFAAAARRAYSRAWAITACSVELSSGALRLGASADRTHLISWGADPGAFACPVGLEEVRQRWGFTQQDRLVVTVGRLVAKKGYEHLVRALPAVLETVKNTRLMIVGDGPERTHLEELAIDLGVRDSIIFTGPVSWNDVPAYLHMGEVFVVPSVHDEAGNVDGLPTTILEAMAAGKPIVASGIAGIPLVVKDGETGILVAERQPAQLAQALVRLLSDSELRREFGRAARYYVETELNWQSVARRFVDLYERAREDCGRR